MQYTHLSSEPLEDLFQHLQSGANGLSSERAAQLLVQQKKTIFKSSRYAKELKLLVRQFTNPLILLLLVAVFFSALLGDTSDVIIILFILIITGLLGFYQEVHAGRALEKLQHMIQTKVQVIRDGKNYEVPSDEVVTGDLIRLDAGDMIPADCRIIESNELHVNESSITGESYPVEKMPGTVADSATLHEKTNCLWQGTNVISGTGTAIAVQTANDTIFGQMAHSLLETRETTFEKGIKRFGYFLLRITIILSLSILIFNIYFHKPFFESLIFSLALAIGMAPELLPAIMTFAMSAGARRMMQQKVIVKKLSSIFNFGEVNLLCTDKTGTVTEGNIKVKDLVNADGQPDELLRQYAYLNAVLQNGFTNPIDKAIKELNVGLNGYSKINEIPYDFIRKRLSVAVASPNSKLCITKGALPNVLEICSSVFENNKKVPIDAALTKRLQNEFENYSRQGYRVLGLAFKELETEKITRADEQQMVFLGFILLEDPLKENVLDTLEKLEQLQIDIKIITGDNRFAAFHTATSLGFTQPQIITGDQLDQLSPEALTVKALQTNIFAEIEPHQKERIVKALQNSKRTVAYIGDGINDVAAINAADIGISTNNAVDVAKEAADFVMLEKDLSVLCNGVYEGRKSFANSIKYILINTGATFGNMISVAGASLILSFLPMLPKQILLTNLISSFPFLTIASDNVEKDQLLKPRKWDMNLIVKFMVVFGIHSSLFDFITFYVLYNTLQLRGMPFQTGWFLESVLTEILILFIIRTPKPFFKSSPSKMLVISGSIALLVSLWLPVSPLAPLLSLQLAHALEAICMVAITIAYVITADLIKVVFFRVVGQ